MKIGEIIASQLGGTAKLNAMTGAYNFLLLEDGLSFRLKNPSANYVKIELNSKDLYDVEIGKVKGNSYKIVHEYHDIHNNQLKEVIEMGTGMYLSLEEGGDFGAGNFEDGGAVFNPQTATFFIKNAIGEILLKTKSLNKASDYYYINKNNISPIFMEAVDANGVVKKLYYSGGDLGVGNFAEGGDINGFTMQVIRGSNDTGQTEVKTEERKISFEKGGALGVGNLENVNFDFTVDEWGGFDIGDGEYFKENLKSLFESNPEFFIKTEKFDDYYETTFIPNPFNPKDLSEVGDKELHSMYENSETYKTTKSDILKALNDESKIGIYNIVSSKKTKKIEINDTAWYYLGLNSSGVLKSKTPAKESPKYKELQTLYKKTKEALSNKKTKYIPHREIKTVTIKKGEKELTYDGEDTYNGVYVLENGGALKGKANYIAKRDVVNVKLKNGEEVKPINGFWIKKTAQPITDSKASDADSIFKKIIRDAKLVKVGDFKKYDAKDLKKINVDMVERLLQSGYTEQQIRNVFLGYAHDNKVLATGEYVEYETTIFSYTDEYVPTIIQKLVDSQKTKSFAVTLEYPDFDWSELIEKYKISTTPKEFVKERVVSNRYDYYYEFFQGKNIVIDHSYGYKEFSSEGKLKTDTTKYGNKLVDANKLNTWQKEKGYRSGFNGSFWTVSSSKIEVIDDVMKILTSQNDGYCKEISFYSDYNSDLLKKNGAKFEKGGDLAEVEKVNFDEKSEAIAKKFVNKKVEPKYQSEYGKKYSKTEAEEVGDKIAGAQKAKYDSNIKKSVQRKNNLKKNSAKPIVRSANELARKIRKDGEKWTDAVRRAYIQLKE